MTRKPVTSLTDLPSNTVRGLGDLQLGQLRAWAEQAGQRFVEIDLSGLADKTAVLKAIGQALAFPAWYGANLDALYDCLTDLPEQAGGGGYLLVLKHLPYTEQFDVEQRDALLDVFRDAAEQFADQGLPLRVLYSSS